jgi:hypothetical protein
MTLLQETIELLRKDRGNWPTTAADTGLGREWLSKLAQGAIDDPGVVKIEKLNAYLVNKYGKAA